MRRILALRNRFHLRAALSFIKWARTQKSHHYLNDDDFSETAARNAKLSIPSSARMRVAIAYDPWLLRIAVHQSLVQLSEWDFCVRRGHLCLKQNWLNQIWN